MIALFTDFGLEGPYVGQLQLVLHRGAPGVPIINLFSDVPAYNAKAAAYLLAAYSAGFPRGTVFLCVVDPGVGGESRIPVVVDVDGRHFVGPDNGLFVPLVQRGTKVKRWEIVWRPRNLSASFHGRDLFAPIAAELALRKSLITKLSETGLESLDRWPADCREVIYIDHFGNAMTGIRADQLGSGARLKIGAHVFRRAKTFSDVEKGRGFWYDNSNGLAEIAINCGAVSEHLNLCVGDTVTVIET